MSDFVLKELKIEVTYGCPLACIHCSSNAGKENPLTMLPEKCMEILTNAIHLGVEQIAFSGGEPLIWGGLSSAVEYAHHNNVQTSIYTSGNVSDPKTIFQNLKKCGLDKAVFSLYSDDEHEHDLVTRIRGSLCKTLLSIDACRTSGVIPEIHFVALAGNYHKLPKIVSLAEAHGVAKVSVLRFVPQGRGALIGKSDTMSKEQNLDLRRMIQRLRKEGHDIRTGSPFNVLWLNESPKCMAGRDRLVVAPDAAIYPCDAFKQIHAEAIADSPEYSVLNQYSLSDCWEKSKYLQTVRQAILTAPKEPCGSCSAYSQCGSGCLAQKYLRYGVLDKNPDPACIR